MKATTPKFIESPWSKYPLGISLALFPIERIGWIAVVSMIMMIVISITVVLYNLEKLKTLNKWIFIPLAILTVLCIVRGDTYGRFYIIGLSCLAVTIALLGKEVLKPLGFGVIAGSISVIVVAATSGFSRTGGMYHDLNYNLAFGTLVFGALLWRFKYQWVVISAAIVGCLFTGADEFFVVLAVLAVAILVRRDFSKKILPTVGIICLCGILLLTPTGQLWTTEMATIFGRSNQTTQTWVQDDWNYRVQGLENAAKNLTIFGNGYAPDNTKQTTAHNVELRVLYDLGPLGLILWLYFLFYGLRRTTWKYAWLGVLAMSIFDHFEWTQLCPYWFVLIGICSYEVKKDWIFKDVEKASEP